MTDKFLTAKELGIKQWEYNRLIEAIGILKSDEIKRVKNPKARVKGMNPTVLRFNMQCCVSEYKCGTALCIGGLIKSLQLRAYNNETGGIKITENHSDKIVNYVSNPYDSNDFWMNVKGGHSEILYNLFYPINTNHREWPKLTPKQGAKAIRRFLSGNVTNPW